MEKLKHLATQKEHDALRREMRRRSYTARTLGVMHFRHGVDIEHICRDCAHFKTISKARDYYKCAHYGNAGGPASDWRASWTACGLFTNVNIAE